MYRVLIVEDEDWIRCGIVQSIDWARLNMELASAVSNGEQAIQVLEQQSVDIVLTDMKMPVCDGGGLLQYIKSKGLDCEVIVISEHTDFEYTRQAIHAHVAEYLLKPITPAQLNEELSHAALRLSSQRLSRKENLDPFDSVFLTALARSSQQHFESICARYGSEFSEKCLIVACIQPEILYTSGYYESIEKLARSAPYPTRAYPCHDPKNIVCLFSIIPAPFNAGANSLYSTWIRQFFMQHKELWGGDVRIGISRAIDTPLNLKTALSASLSALQFLHHGHGEITHYDNISDYDFSPDSPIICEQQIIDILSSCKKQEAAKLRQFFMDSLSCQDLLYIPLLRQMLIDFTLTLEKCSNKVGYAINITTSIGENYIDRIGRIEWLSEANSFLCEVLDHTFLNIASKRSLTTADIVDEVIKRIETHYMDDINLMQISQQFHINYVHLSRQFKERTGELFSDFLLRVRMTKAKKFIEDSGFSEKDTATLVGYSNPYYFSSSYKKYFQKKEDE